MKKLMLWIVMAAASATALQAQEISGTWQGSLQPPGAPNALRLVMKISKEVDQLKGTLYSIDQGAQSIAATVTVQGGTVRMSVAPAGISYEGKLAADGNSIVGTFTQGPGNLPLTLTRANKETAWALPAPPKTMAADAPTAFEVATIRPSNPDAQGRGITMRGPREVLTINTPLGYLIEFAYNVNTRQVFGGPSWIIARSGSCRHSRSWLAAARS